MAARRTTETKSTTTRTTRQTAATTEAAAAAPRGMNMVDACLIVSGILLIVAFVLLDKFRGEAFGDGMFFKG